MLFRDPSKPELVVEIPPNGKQPKAVVILLGWFGAKFRHVKKYAELYEKRGCTTICAILDNRSIMLADTIKMDEFATAVAKEAAKHLRQAGNDEVPLVCHAFSNGGCLPLTRMQLMMMEKIPRDEEDVDDWILLQDRYRLGGVVLDSSPAFPDLRTFKRAIQGALRSRVLAYIIFLLMAMYWHVCSLFLEVQGKQTFLGIFWSHWENSSQLTRVQAFIYSTADTITRYQKLDELVKTRMAHAGANVLVKRFDDSDHVQHMMAHKEEYCNLIDKILERGK
ncbi:Transmembrane protein 53 [Seminavis robusta]|uniref:Transmembrane protein 53 n=1 Tax=Seminavis robusta TaxID=568900 RepID=A0A9N8ELC2_9STRA|nr:Transmembrane protein 53 [Seminavis robusta]|eukprot:Sro1121_g243400.1 Transmembrane protein 53 (279) ;mRNA; r:18258-19094